MYTHTHFFILFVVKKCVPGRSSEKSHLTPIVFSFPRKSMRAATSLYTFIVKTSGPNLV